MAIGRLYGVGVGPGNPDWITVAAHRIVTSVPVIAYPRGVGGTDGYALGIVERFLTPGRPLRLPLDFPMTREPGPLRKAWITAVEQLWDKLSAEFDVAFITEGDPLFYSTFVHVWDTMRYRHPEVPMEIVPGISSLHGASARLPLALADGDQRVGIVPATADATSMREALQTHDTVVFMKVAKVLPLLVSILEDMNLLDHAQALIGLSSPQERVIRDVRALMGQRVPYMTLVVVSRWRSAWLEESWSDATKGGSHD